MWIRIIIWGMSVSYKVFEYGISRSKPIAPGLERIAKVDVSFMGKELLHFDRGELTSSLSPWFFDKIVQGLLKAVKMMAVYPFHHHF